MATIRCGKCSRTHESVQAVRLCYGATVPTQPSSNIFAAPSPSLAAAGDSVAQQMAASVMSQLHALRDQVNEGHYAVQDGDTLRFLRVSVRSAAPRGVSGSHGRRVFLDEQASDELYPVRAVARQIALLRLIVADPRAALVRYGHEIGKCGVCNRTLTDADSRAAGIGPTCASRLS